MKTMDVESLLYSIDALLAQINNQKTQLKDLEQSVLYFTELEDSFMGNGGSAIRHFYRDWHLPYLSHRFYVLDKFEQILIRLKMATSQFEPDPSGYILQSFLEGDLTDGINEVNRITESLVDEGNGYMDAVSDIVSLPRLNDEEFYQCIQDATNDIIQTIQDLNLYDQNQTNELASLDQDIHLMNGYLHELEGIFKGELFDIATYNLKVKDYPHAAQIQVNFAKRTVAEFLNVFRQFSATFWGIFGKYFIQKNVDTDEYIYEMLRGFERQFENLGDLENATDDPHATEFEQGVHLTAKGEELDLALIEKELGVSIETFNLRGVPLHYAVINGKLVIFRDNPDIWYYTQYAEVSALAEIMGTTAKNASTAAGDYFLGRVGNRIPGAAELNKKMENLPEVPGSNSNVGDIAKEQLSEGIQTKIPLWGEIISADVPKAGTKQVLVYLGGDGKDYDRRAMFTIGKDGVLSIDDWYVGELNTVKQKEKEKVDIHDLYNWATNGTDPNNSTDASEKAKQAVDKYALKENKDSGFTQGKGLNLNELEFVKDIDIHTTATNNIPINYSVVAGDLVIFPDNPDVYYYQQNVEYGAGTEVLGQYLQNTISSIGENQLGKLAGKIPGAPDLNKHIDSLPNLYNTDVATGDILKGTASDMIQNHIPGWEKIASAPVPEAGEKQVLLTVSEDGENVSGVKLFRLKEDGTVTMY